MRAFAIAFLVFVTGCSAPPPGKDGGDGGGTGGAGGQGGSGGGSLADPADAGVPTFTAATFCEVFAKTYCAWAVTCGQRTAGEQAGCVAIKQHECPRALTFDATAAQVCLLKLEAARCNAAARIAHCEGAWPASVPDGGACVATRECLAGVCVTDGGACGVCGRPGEEGELCDATHPCNRATARCGVGEDAGRQCLGKLDAGEKCAGLGDEACKTDRCLFKAGQGLVCVTASPGGTCSSNAGCAAALYCDPVLGGCRVPELVGANCSSQEACARYGNVCLRGKCTKVTPFSVAEGAPCTETAQCAWGLACDLRAALPVCVRRVAHEANCQLKGLDPWDPRCPYLAMCDPAKGVCVPASTLCTFNGYCPTGPGPNEPCKQGNICRGVSSCSEAGDGGYRCFPTEQPAGAACFDQFATQACSGSSCVGGTCAAWPPVPSCP